MPVSFLLLWADHNVLCFPRKLSIFADMKTTTILTTCLTLLLLHLPQQILADHTLHLVPSPVSLAQGKGYFNLTSHTVFAVENAEQQQMAQLFVSLLQNSAGITPRVSQSAQGDVQFITDSSLPDEAYQLTVTQQHIRIHASNASGFFYALQTLRMALPGSIETSGSSLKSLRLPVMTVSDAPRFGYRGFMLDVARYFSPKAEVLKIIDCMAILKLNTLHLHLTDDNGWRLEIKRYPKLTEVGAWRVDRGNQPFPDRRNATPGEKATVGGYYTQQDMKEIIAYAAERQIEIIPEIDIPGHSNAAIASYPELACPVVDKYFSVLPGMGADHSAIVLCAGKESVYTFYQHVIDEVAELFPGSYIHLGGDEAQKHYWKQCPLCQQRMQQEGLANEEDLQGYFMSRLSAYVQQKGKKVMGWDELTNTRLPQGAIIMGWRGYGQAAIKAAKAGHPFIMTPARALYLIRYQGPQWFEPLTYFGNITLKDVYDYEPIQPDWEPAYESLLMGVQASMWTEFCSTPAGLTHQVFPRLAALAEIAWTPKDQKNWSRFLQGLDPFLQHLDAKDVVYARSMYNIQHEVRPTEQQTLAVKLECIRPDVQIRYTTNGSAPTAHSRLYRQPIELNRATTVRALTFQGGKPVGEELQLPIQWNKATAKPILQAANNTCLLVNGVHGSLRQSDFEWSTWMNDRPASFTLDLLQEEEISQITVRCLTNYAMAVHKPLKLEVAVSADNQHFEPLEEKNFRPEEIFKEGNFIEELTFPAAKVKARYIRFTAQTPGLCPLNHLRPQQASRYCFDEISVE